MTPCTATFHRKCSYRIEFAVLEFRSGSSSGDGVWTRSTDIIRMARIVREMGQFGDLGVRRLNYMGLQRRVQSASFSWGRVWAMVVLVLGLVLWRWALFISLWFNGLLLTKKKNTYGNKSRLKQNKNALKTIPMNNRNRTTTVAKRSQNHQQIDSKQQNKWLRKIIALYHFDS